MMGVASGIAQISFPGGRTILSVRSPYEREILVEHVALGIRAKGRVQVLIDDQRWVVRAIEGQLLVGCPGCGRSLHTACYSTADIGIARCVRCAFAPHADAPFRGTSMAVAG